MHTTTVTLRLIFYGLLAFTPDGFQPGQEMRALLIDARHPPVASDGCPIHPHMPMLMFKAPRCESPCRLEAGLCRCELDRDLLHVGLAPARSCAQITSCGVDRICAVQRPSGAAADGPSRVPKLGWLKIWNGSLRLRPECDVAYPALDPPPDRICDLVGAQVNFQPQGDFQVCAFSGEPPRAPGGIPPPTVTPVTVPAQRFKFKPLTSKNILDVFGLLRWGLNRRHLAEIVMTETELVIGCSSSTDPRCGKQVQLEVVAFDCGESYTFTIETFPRGGRRYADLIVANHPDTQTHDFGYLRCRDHFIARDFELYHDLARGPMYTSDRPVPQPWRRDKLEQAERVECASETLRILQEELLRTGEIVPICPGTRTSSP